MLELVVRRLPTSPYGYVGTSLTTVVVTAKTGSALQAAPAILEQFHRHLAELDEVTFGIVGDSSLGEITECQVAIRDQAGGVDRGCWLVDGELGGGEGGRVVFRVSKARYLDELGVRHYGERLTLYPDQVLLDADAQEWGGIRLRSDTGTTTDEMDPLLRSAMRFVDHSEAREREQASRSTRGVEVLSQTRKCHGCAGLIPGSTSTCGRCGQSTSDAAYLAAEARLENSTHDFAKGDEVVMTDESGGEHVGITVSRVIGRLLRLAFVRRAGLPSKGTLTRAPSVRVLVAQRRGLSEIVSGEHVHLHGLISNPTSWRHPTSAAGLGGGSQSVAPNEEQARAIALTCGMKWGDVLLVQGPPGTGKTRTIVEAIVQISFDQQSRVLFSSHSNDAVDSGQQLLRAHESVRQARLAAADRAGDTVADLVLKDDIQGFNIVAGTVARLTMDKRIIEAAPFDWLVLDEANKVRISEALPLMALARRWVLIGDPRQLAPLEDDASRSFAVRDEADLIARDVSLYEWLWSHLNSGSLVQLRQQYRMRSAIGELVSNLFYEGSLVHHGPDQGFRFPWPLKKQIVWVDAALGGERRGQAGSLSNDLEIAICADLATLLGSAVPKPTVSVLSAYADQVEKLKTVMATAIPDADVASVDAFEGREADVVVLSLVRSNDRAQIGFLNNIRRLNVALSRARHLLVIVGDRQTLLEASSETVAALDRYVTASPEAVHVQLGGIIKGCRQIGRPSAISALRPATRPAPTGRRGGPRLKRPRGGPSR